MADLTVNVTTTLAPDDVIVRAVQFFTNDRWRAQSQTSRIATFAGMPKIPIVKLMILMFLIFCFVVPGLIYYIFVVRSMRRLQNIVVTTTPGREGCSVVVTYPKHAQKMVDNFIAALPNSTNKIAVAGR